MKRPLLLVALLFFGLITIDIQAQIPALPDSALTEWVIDEPEEIVSYIIFDPAMIEEKLPPNLRFITIEELAKDHIIWACEHLGEYPTHASWGISFIEIVRMKTFRIDGHSPVWPENGAAALWCARVVPLDSTNDIGSERPFLAIEFWIPDSMFVKYIREKGHYANYGDVRLRRDSDGKWIGSVEVNDLNLSCECKPTDDMEVSGSFGKQVFFPPAHSEISSIVRIAFAGHQTQLCEETASWKFEGSHPIVNGVILGPTSFQHGYILRGGAYHQR